MSKATVKKQALLIGINQYQKLPALKYARQDSEAVEETLKRNYGFSDDEVVLLTDAKPGLLSPTNRKTILSHLENLANQNLDLFIFGFWGHGLFCNGKRYLCPMDVSIDKVEQQGFSFSELQQHLTNIRANNTCMILDCCQRIYSQNQPSAEYTGVPAVGKAVELSRVETLTAADQTDIENAARDIGLNIQEKEPEFNPNVAILNSCSEGQSAYEWDKREHGIFTAHLLDAFNHRYNSVAQIAAYVSREVPKTAMALGKKQIPLYCLKGDIVLPYRIDTEDSAKAVIVKPVIDDIDITITPRIIEQQNPIQYENITLPPKPEDLLRIPAENEGLKEAIEQLKTLTHESLRQANDAVALAQAQLDAWSKRREERWGDLPKKTQKSWEKEIVNNPDCKDDNIVQQGDLSNQQYLELVEKFQCGKKYQQAKLELERVERERKSKCDEAIVKFQQKIEDNNRCYKERLDNFLDEVLLTILGVMKGYDDLDAQYPENEILAPLYQLDKYELGWKASDEKKRARQLWENQHPCVIENKKKKQDQIDKEEQLRIAIENQQKKLEERNRKRAVWKVWIAIGLVLFLILFIVLMTMRSKYLEKERINNLFKLEPGQTAGERAVITFNGVEFAFRWCPAGSFIMGSETNKELSRYHKVTLTKGFWMLETEVTQKQWEAVMNDNPSRFFSEENLPVEEVSWNDCKKFCRKTGLQIPTEAQWEYACRAGSREEFAGNLDEMAWYSSNSGGKTHPVGTKKPNAWGLYDMHGNVWEWCEDRFGYYPSGNDTDPTGPSTLLSLNRVFRGGGWGEDAFHCQSGYRCCQSPLNRNCLGSNYIDRPYDYNSQKISLGFRCVKNP